MRFIIIAVLLSLSVGLKASEPLRIGVITDLHYLSERLMDDGTAVDKYMESSGRMIKYTPFVLDSVLRHFDEGWADDIAAIDILLVCGDMTKDGERQSHLDFVEKLKPLQKKGVKVFVVPGNHDINMPNSVGYKDDKTYKVDNVSPKEFVDIYKDCGYNFAFERDTASLSYVALIEKGHSTEEETWLIVIDAARYNEYTTRSISGGRISPQTERWILSVLDKAKQKNAQVIGMMHWGLVEHFPMQSTFLTDYLVDDYQRLSKLFADNGMIAVFTGHNHANDITQYTSPESKRMYDISTGTLSAYPFSYRFVDYYPTNMNISTFNIESLPQNLGLAELSKLQLQEVARKIAIDRMKNYIPDLSVDKQSLIADIFSKLFLLQVGGDEVVSDDLKAEVKKLMGNNVGEDDEEPELDFFPADNNVTITY